VAALAYLASLALRTWLPRIPLPPRACRLLGLSLVVAGGALLAWFARSMRQAQTAMNPTKPATALVTGGPFAFSRNPGYLGLTTVYTGLALALNSLAALLLLPGVLLVVTRGLSRARRPT
jgi:protein-S-isoprenylcysteine O-methyltransferase Ste14